MRLSGSAGACLAVRALRLGVTSMSCDYAADSEISRSDFKSGGAPGSGPELARGPKMPDRATGRARRGPCAPPIHWAPVHTPCSFNSVSSSG